MKQLFVTLLITFGSIAQSADHSLDLIAARKTTDSELLSVPDSERVMFPTPLPKGAVAAPTFTITGLTLDRSTYQVGEVFEYEYLIRYTGTTTTAFPVSSESHLFRQSMNGLKFAALDVLIDDSLRGPIMQSVELLYGSTDVSGSLAILNPNETIRVRGKGRWKIGATGSPLPDGWAKDVSPFVTLHFVASATVDFQARSTPSLTIQLARPQAH